MGHHPRITRTEVRVQALFDREDEARRCASGTHRMRWPRCARRILFTLEHAVSKGRARARSSALRTTTSSCTTRRRTVSRLSVRAMPNSTCARLPQSLGTLRIRGTRSSQPTGARQLLVQRRCSQPCKPHSVELRNPRRCHASFARDLRSCMGCVTRGQPDHRDRSVAHHRRPSLASLTGGASAA